MIKHELQTAPISAIDSLEKGREFIFSALTSHYRIMIEVDKHIKLIRNELEEIKTLKEQLAEAVDVIEKCRRHNYLGGEAFLDRITKQFLEKQDKENKDEK